MDAPFMDEFKELLMQYRQQHIAMFVPDGNNGDKLIYLGLVKLLKSIDISFSEFKYSESPRFSIFGKS